MKYFNKLILSNLKINLTFATMFLILGMSWGQVTYYSKAAATNFNDVNSWGTAADGTGASPASITTADNYIVANASVLNLTANAGVRSLTINTGTLTVAANTLLIEIPTQNNTELNVTSGGQLNLTGGTINVNGAVYFTNNAGFNQSGGLLKIDPNSGTAATSIGGVGNTTAKTFGIGYLAGGVTTSAISSAVNVAKFQLTGGIVQIVDPTISTSTSAYSVAIVTNFALNLGVGHTIKFGDGVSTQAAGNVNGFYIYMFTGSSYGVLGNVEVDVLTGTSRWVKTTSSVGILGNLTITSGEFWNSSVLYITGNIVNNGIFTSTSTLYFGSYFNATVAASTVAQNVSGAGTFRNLQTAQTASFNGITVNNTNAAGITFASPSLTLTGGATGTVSGTLNFTAGKVSTSGQTFVMGISGAAGTTNYTAGGFTSGSIFSRNWSAAGTGTNIAAGTDPSTATSRYPFVTASGAGRSAFIERTGPSAIGTIAIQYTEVAGTTPVSIVDGVYTANTRSNDNWAVSGSAPATSYELAIVAPGVYTALDNTSRLTLASGVIGTHQAGTITPGGQRVLTAAQLVNTFYLAINNPTCLPPSAPVSSAITYSSATISWTASPSTPSSGYDYYVSTSNTPPIVSTIPTGSTVAGITTANLTLLTANTTYYFWIRSNCGAGDLSSWTTLASFYTGYCIPAPSSVDGLGITNVSFSTVNNTTGAESGNYGDYSAQVGNVVQGNTTNVNITYQAGATYDTKIWVDWNNDLDFDDVGEDVYTGVSLSNNPTTLMASFIVPIAAPLGQHRMRIGGRDLGAPTPCYVGTWGTYEDYTVNVVAPSADAMDYANLQFPATANIITGGSATIYTQGFEPGVTPPAGAGPGITVWIGVNATNTDPATWSGGSWTAATFNTQVGNNDEFQANIGSSLPTGTYYYASRWQLNTGPYVYGGYNVGGGGFWNGTSNVSGVLTVTAAPGIDCSNPIIVSSYPYTSSTTTCGSVNDYSTQCSGNYGGGEDLVYQLNIPAAGTYQISVTATGGGSYIGWFLKDAANCATGSSCLANATSGSGTLANASYTFAASGTYFLIIDTWPSPTCSAFNISITTIACGAPIASAATLINSTTANANWTPTTGSFIIEYGPTSTFGTPGAGATAGNVNNTVVTASNVGTKQLTSLTATTGYSYVVRQDCTGSANGYSLNSSTITFTTLAAPPANDEATSATAISLGVGCTGAIYTNLNATPTSASPTEPKNSGGDAFKTVWFTFVAPASGAVRVSTDLGSGNTLTDSRVALYSATNPADYTTFTCISTDEDGGSVLGSGYMSVVYATGLISGNTYYIQVGTYGSFTTAGTFCMTVDELNSTMLALTATCVSTIQFPEGTNAAYTGWVPFLDGSGKLIALIKNPTGASPDSYEDLDQNINTGAVRTDGAGKRYLDRNYSFSNPTAGPYDLQLFFLTSERTALGLVDPSANTLSNLNVTRDPNVGCKAFPTGGDNTLLTQLGSGSVGGVDWVRVSTPGFSGFFINTGLTPLPVNILSFDAKSLNNKTVQLTWNVASEVDVREYIVERSNDNRNWSAIGSVKASQKSTYGFNDNSPVSGVNYYRLAVKDVNASVAYSDIRTVNFSGKGNMALYPNPANNTLYVSGTDDKNVVVSIYNEVGHIVTTLSSNGETIRTGGIDVSQLLPGAYSIQVKGESGLTTMRFVKQ